MTPPSPAHAPQGASPLTRDDVPTLRHLARLLDLAEDDLMARQVESAGQRVAEARAELRRV